MIIKFENEERHYTVKEWVENGDSEAIVTNADEFIIFNFTDDHYLVIFEEYDMKIFSEREILFAYGNLPRHEAELTLNVKEF